MAHVLTKVLKFSPNGYEVEHYAAGEYDELPEAALEAAERQGILEKADAAPKRGRKKKQDDAEPEASDESNETED